MATSYEIVQFTDEEILKEASGKILNNGDVKLAKGRLSVAKGGIFDYSIFGHPNTCYCQRIKIIGEYCPYCHTKAVSEQEFRESFGYYPLNAPYINVLRIKAFVDYLYEMEIPIGITTRGKKGTENLLKTLWNITVKIASQPQDTPDDKVDLYDSQGNKYKLEIIQDIEETGKFNFGLCGLYQLADFYNKSKKSLEGIKGFINHNLIITSPAERMYKKFNSSGRSKVIMPRQNFLYKAVIFMNSSLDALMENNFPSDVDRATLFYLQNYLIYKCQSEESLIATSKESLIRNLVCTRVMESGRSTVVGDPQLPIDEIIIPHSLAYQMIDLQIIEGLAKKGFLKDAKNKYRKCDEDAIAVMHEIIEHSCATLVRNPSLHKFNMMSFKIRLTEDDVAIHVPILICPSYAMDFDGDQSFVQIHTDPMRVASFESMRPQNNWFYEKRNKGPVYVPQHEVLFGLYMASRITRGETIKGFETLADARKAYDDNKITVSEVVIIDDVTTTFGRAIISDIIGSQLNNITGIDKPIDTDKIVEVMRFLEGKENRVEALRKLQIFGSTIATNIGLESLPFKNIYGQNNKEIDAIANSNEPVGVRVNKLKDFFEDTMKKKISADPDSNLSHLIKGSGRVKYSQLVEIYAPTMIIKDKEIIIDHSNVFEGLSQRAYTELSKNNRALLEMKSELTPVSGYDNRQLVNLQMRLIYRNIDNPNPDKVGILIPRKLAYGRVNVEDGQRVSEKNGSNDLIRVRSTINNKGNIVYRDEINPTKMTITDNSGIGCNFATALMESVTQSALALKHGGSTINYEKFVTEAIEPGAILEITNDYIRVKGAHDYKYPLTTYTSPNIKLEVGDKVDTGTVLVYSTKRTVVDQALCNFNTLVDTHVTGDLGMKGRKILSYSPYSGKIHYDFNQDIVTIGNHAIPFEKDYLYYYPEGYDVQIGTMISTGVLDINKFHEIVSDPGVCFYAFYDAICTSLLKKSGEFNSEPVETLFKSIMDNGFSVEDGNNNNPNYLERVYKGNTKGSFEEAIKNSPKGTISLEDTLLLPILMRKENKTI